MRSNDNIPVLVWNPVVLSIGREETYLRLNSIAIRTASRRDLRLTDVIRVVIRSSKSSPVCHF